MKRFSKNLIPYYFVSSIVYSFFIFILVKTNLINEDGTNLKAVNKLSLIIALVAYVVIVIYSIIYYFKTGYELKEKEIYCTRGVLFKKQSILDYSKIHAVNKKQGLIQRMFGLATITVDSGSTNTSHQAEITIIENVELVDSLIEEIKARQNGNFSNDYVDDPVIEEKIEKENLYNFTAKTKFIYTTLNTLGGLIGVLFCFVFGFIVLNIINNYIGFSDGDVGLFEILFGFLGLSLLTIAGIAFSSIIISFVQYYDFRIFRTSDSIEINYGLFTKQQNTFKLNRVKGIRIKQRIIQRLFGFATINLEVIGYSNTTSNNNQQAQAIGVLIPLCKYKDINLYLDKILPNYKPEEKEYKTIKFLPFISYYLIFSSITLGLIFICAAIPLAYYGLWDIVLYSFIGVLSFFILLVATTSIDRYLEYKNNGLKIKDNKVTIYRGGWTKETVVVLKDNIIGIEKATTYHRNKEGINSYIIHFKSNALTNTIEVKNISIEAYKELLDLMKY